MRLFINSAGAGNGYFLAQTAKKRFAGRIRLIAGDMSEPSQVAAATLADEFVTTPPVASPHFRDDMTKILKDRRADYYVPLVPIDCITFPFRAGDAPLCLSVPVASASLFEDKFVQHQRLDAAGIAVEDYFDDPVRAKETAGADRVMVKPRQGYGSAGVFDLPAAASGHAGGDVFYVGKCRPPEHTVDVLNWKGRTWTVTRERLQTKAGVSTKVRAYFSAVHDELARSLCARFEMPAVFCFQTMVNARGETVVTDLNCRIGAGSSMSRFAGIDFAYNMIGLQLGFIAQPQVSQVEEVYVARVYQDLVMEHPSARGG